MLLDVVAQVGALAALATALGLLARLRPVRWVYQQLVGAPLKRAFRAEVTDVIRIEVPAMVREELALHPLTNGWGVTAVQAIADATGAIGVEPPANPEGVDPDAPTRGDP